MSLLPKVARSIRYNECVRNARILLLAKSQALIMPSLDEVFKRGHTSRLSAFVVIIYTYRFAYLFISGLFNDTFKARII
jgi:hypothetical protein